MHEVVLEIAAFAVAAFCLSWCLLRHPETYQHVPAGSVATKLQDRPFVFVLLLVTVLVSAVSSVSAATVEALFPMRGYLLFALHMVYYLFHNPLAYLFFVYIVDLCATGEAQQRKAVVSVIPLLAATELMVLANPVTNWFFYLDETLAYHRGPLLWALYAPSVLFAVSGLGWLIHHRKALPEFDRRATIMLLTVALIGVAIQMVWNVTVELLFESFAFLGFMVLAEDRDALRRRGLSTGIFSLLVLVFLCVILMNVSVVHSADRAQIEEIGAARLGSIRGDLQQTISEAEECVLRAAVGAERLVAQEADAETLAAYVSERRADCIEDTRGACFNLYMADPDTIIIPGYEMPEDYHTTERSWYQGAVEASGTPYVTDPYADAATGAYCFTVSVALSDGRTVVAADFGFDGLQKTAALMAQNGNDTALIVTASGVIAGYADESLVGQRLADRLVPYMDVFERVSASKEHTTFEAVVDGREKLVFSDETRNQWYLILCADTQAFFDESRQQTILLSAINILMLCVVVVFYLASRIDHREMERQLAREQDFIEHLSTRLRAPVRKLVTLSDANLLATDDDGREVMEEIRTSSLSLVEVLDAMLPFAKDPAPAGEADARPEAAASSEAKDNLMRNAIVAVLCVAFGLGLALCLHSSAGRGDALMSQETDVYAGQLSQWVTKQQSVLNLLSDVIAQKPDLMDDYDEAVAFLDGIVANHPEVSACYLANPYRDHSVIMNNGWEPEAGWKVEERDWYRATERSVTGSGISAPYPDAQTGLYCITFSRVIYGSQGEFVGILAIDCYMDRLIGVLDESYSERGYAFLVDAGGLIVNHPNAAYQMTQESSTSIEDTAYAEAYHAEGVSTLTDYDGRLVSCSSWHHSDSGFTVVVAMDWWGVYGGLVAVSVAFACLLALAVASILTLIARLLERQRHTNDRLAEAAAAAQAADRAKSQFLAQMSHEIRTPINAILGMNEMILYESDDPEILGYARNVQSAGNTLLGLVNSILDFSKIEDGKMKLVCDRYETLEMIDDLVNLVSEAAAKKGLDLVLKISPLIPKTLYGDDMRLREVVTNILTNAVKYTQEGSVTLTMYARTDENGEWCDLMVSVADTGIGIREEDLDKLSRSFTRLDEERNRHIEGTGLGMSIVARLLALMGSGLKVESEYGQGSTFSFSVRQRVVVADPIGPYQGPSNHPTAEAATHRTLWAPDARVLVVDDNEMNLEVARMLLARTGIACELAASGSACLERARQDAFDLILLDIMMPGMDGVTCLKHLREDRLIGPATTVVAVTANAVSGARDDYLAAGFDDYLAKPIDIDELQDLIARHLGEGAYTYREADRHDRRQEEPTPSCSSPQLAQLAARGVDTRAGLAYAAGDEGFYLDMLQSLAAGTPARRDELLSHLAAGDLGSYEIAAHALKGNARMLGCSRLARVAADHETLARDLRQDDLEAGWDSLEREMARVQAAIEDALGEGAPNDTTETLKAGPAPDIAETLAAAGACLENFEGEEAAIRLRAARAESAGDAELGRRLEQIIAMCEDFELNAARDGVCALLADLEGRTTHE